MNGIVYMELKWYSQLIQYIIKNFVTFGNRWSVFKIYILQVLCNVFLQMYFLIILYIYI